MATAYWEDRVKLAQRAIDRRDNILINKLSGSFDRINRQLNNDIGKIISTYTRKTGLTPEQAFQYLNEGLPQNVRNELLAKIQTVSSARERGKLETIMRTDRYQDRITRMDAIKADTRIALTKNAEVQIGEVTNHLKKTAQESYARSMFDIQKASGYAFSPHGVSADSINKILRTPWSGSTYSSRIWKAKDVMASNLDSVMTEMFSMGKLSDKTLKDLQGAVSFDKWKQQATSKFKNETQYAKYNVQRLIRTETNYVANAADAEAYEECEIEKYEFIAVLDLRTSAVCQQHDGKVYSMAEKEEGVNFPPLHPFCRSSVAPSLDSVNRSELQRRARDPETGKNVLIPADMNYNEWKAWVADGSPDIDGWRESKDYIDQKPQATPKVQKSKIDECKTTDDVQALMKSQKWFNSQTFGGKTYDSNDMVSFSGIDIDAAKTIYKSHENLYEKYPQLIGKLNSPGVGNISRQTYAQCFTGSGHGGIVVNKFYYKDAANLEKLYAEDVLKGYHPVGTNWKSIITHELGHAVDDYLSNTLYTSGMATPYKAKYVSADLRPRVMKEAGLKVSDAAKTVSHYATKNSKEWFAECFAEYIDSDNPRQVASIFGRHFEDIMKGVQ